MPNLKVWIPRAKSEGLDSMPNLKVWIPRRYDMAVRRREGTRKILLITVKV